MGILAWIIFGGLVGWIASMIMKTNESQGIGTNILVGIVGSWLAGAIANYVLHKPGVNGFNFWSILVGITGACLAIWVWQKIKGNPA